MKVGLYTIMSLLFIAAVVVFVYLINPEGYSFEVFGIHMPNLPIAVWVALPVALFAIASIFHILFYGTKNFFNLRKWKSDAKRLEDAIYWSLIKEPQEERFNNKALQESASILSFSYIEPLKDGDLSLVSQKQKEVVKVIQTIESGEYVDLKTQKFSKHLSSNNPIIIKNEINHINKDSKYALNVASLQDKYSEVVVNSALDKIAKTYDLYTLKKYAKDLGKSRFLKVLDRVVEEDLDINIELLKSFMENYKLECKDYYKIVNVALLKFNPDDNLAFFRELSNNDEEAVTAYLYLLFKYEMLDKVRDILDEHNLDEYKAFRALYNLKRAKHNFKADEIITIDNFCK